MKKTVLHEKILEQSVKDSLTKAFNRKFYNTKILELFNEFKRYEVPFCLISADIDKFKSVNDNYGHNKGDEVLISFCDLVSKTIRVNDFLIRMGGEEFIIILTNTNLEKGLIVGNKILTTIRENLKVDETKYISVSLGLTEVKKDDDESTIYKRADELLYNSKNSGRDKISY